MNNGEWYTDATKHRISVVGIWLMIPCILFSILVLISGDIGSGLWVLVTSSAILWQMWRLGGFGRRPLSIRAERALRTIPFYVLMSVCAVAFGVHSSTLFRDHHRLGGFLYLAGSVACVLLLASLRIVSIRRGRGRTSDEPRAIEEGPTTQQGQEGQS